MIILGIETSCDETAAAVLTNNNKRITIFSNIVASSATLHAKYGGIIPEQAAREQIKSIIPVIEEALHVSHITYRDIDAIAVTYGPGLIGSLLVGVETAKTLALVWKKPLIPVNHLIGHFYANWIDKSVPQFPCIGLLVSGGHTDLVLFENHGEYRYLGGTRDDAAGECFDKCARLLDLPYPGGPEISKLAELGDSSKFNLPRPMINSKDFDFSFSGLKTAVANLLHTSPVIASARSERGNLPSLKDSSLVAQNDKTLADLAASIEQAIVDVLVDKTIRAARKYNIDQIMIAGGVAANQKLVANLKLEIQNLVFRQKIRGGEQIKINLHVPPAYLCTDNAAMIASAAFFQTNAVDPLKLQADPGLTLISS